MLKSFAGGAEHIILATGATDFRKQISSLSVYFATPKCNKMQSKNVTP